MANKREFKKYVEAVSSAIVNDMLAVFYSIDGVDDEKTDEAVIDVLTASEKAILRVNVKFDKTASAFDNELLYHTARRKFFSELYHKASSEFSKELNEALKKFNSAIPQEVRDKLKSGVSATD